MRNRRSAPVAPAEAPAAEVHIIDPHGIYYVDTARKALRLKASSLRREIREGRLRVCKRCGRHFFLGEQLLNWLRAGEVGQQQDKEGM